MRIAVDARDLPTDDRHREFVKEVFYRLAEDYKEHQFIFMFDSVSDHPVTLPSNVLPVLITPPPSNFFLYKWWYDIKVPLALKKLKSDVFVAAAGRCSFTTSKPQILIVHDFPGKNSTAFKTELNVNCLKKATTICSPSEFISTALASDFRIGRDKIITTGRGASHLYTAISWELREEIKEQYAEGCEYFIFPNGFRANSNLINTLKAFSVFKKWQKSNMKLLICGVKDNNYQKQVGKLQTYKYRNDVKLVQDIAKQELAKLTGAAYAMVFPSFYESFAIPVLEAMQCEVPVITAPDSSMAEMANDAALYANPDQPAEIAEQMKRIFKDEQLRTRLAEQGKQRAKLYSWEKTRALIWQLIEEAVSK